MVVEYPVSVFLAVQSLVVLLAVEKSLDLEVSQALCQVAVAVLRLAMEVSSEAQCPALEVGYQDLMVA